MISAGIYLHIPFCQSKCIYCDFYSLPEREELIPRYVNAICSEIENCQVDTTNWTIDTIFFGGGTPSLLEPKQIERILIILNEKYDISKLKEVTIETNPRTVTADKLQSYRKSGIDRLSIGVQSFQPELLKTLSRIHTVKDAYCTIDSARQSGFGNISCDLIYNIPGHTLKEWRKDLETIFELQPEHISAYSLTVEPHTELYRRVKCHELKMPTESLSSEIFRLNQQLLPDFNYTQYEISNFAQPGYECRHNLHYWRNDPYLGFGPAAHGFDGRKRWNNIRSLDSYLALIENNQSAVEESYDLTQLDRTNELIGFGIRMAEGIDLNRFPGEYRRKISKNISVYSDKWNGYYHFKHNWLTLTKKGMAFADAIAVDWMLAKEL